MNILEPWDASPVLGGNGQSRRGLPNWRDSAVLAVGTSPATSGRVAQPLATNRGIPKLKAADVRFGVGDDMSATNGAQY